jgi:hypothetical protein
MSNAAGTEALACSVAAARLTSASLRLVATRAATRSPDMRAAPTMKRRLGPESVFSAVGDSPWLVDRRGACGGCPCRVAALTNLAALLRHVLNDRFTSSNARLSGVSILSRDQNREELHATPNEASAPLCATTGRPVRSRNRRRPPACRHGLAATSPRYGCATANARAHRVPQHTVRVARERKTRRLLV